ncbi:MAG: flagellar basal-body rod protein FlgG [Bacillota bacterium]
MIRALWSAASGMGAQQLAVDTISNNIANVNTPGFKTSRVDFQDVFYAFLRPVDDPDDLIQVGHGVVPAAVRRAMTAGNLESTGNELDLAVEGKGFFRVSYGATGLVEYTRSGAFGLDHSGRLVTADGRYLLGAGGPLTVPSGAVAINVGPDGRVTARLENGSISNIGQLQLALFPNPAGLEARGENVYRATTSSGQPAVHSPMTGGAGRLAQGFLERSNVQLIDEIVGLISAQRAYELNSKVVQSADEMLGIANNLRR